MATVAVAKQNRVQINVYEQSSMDTIATGASPGMKLHLIDSDLAPRQDLFESPEVNATRMATEPFLDALDVAGGISVQGDPIGVGWFLKWLMGDPTVTGAGPYTHTFKTTTAATKSLTIEKIMNDIAQVIRLWGCKINRLSFDVSRGGVLTFPLDIIGAAVTEATSALDASPYYPPNVAFRVPAVTITEGGGAFTGKATRLAFNLDNNDEGFATLGNSGQFYDIIEGIQRPTGTLTMVFPDRSIYDKAKAGTESSLSVTFPATDGTSSLQITWPEIKYALHAPPFRGGSGPITVDVAWRAYYNNDAGASQMIVTLINSLASYTAAIPA